MRGSLQSIGVAFLWCVLLSLIPVRFALAQVQIDVLRGGGGAGGAAPTSFAELAREVAQRTSIEVAQRPAVWEGLDEVSLAEPWLWVDDLRSISGPGGSLRPDIVFWLKRGGLLIIEGVASPEELARLTTLPFQHDPVRPEWQPIPPDHELMRSFYLLDALPTCQNIVWRGFNFDARMAILAIPYRFLSTVQDVRVAIPGCPNVPERERSTRLFVNLLMVALATDYKKDQIHLPEILKRLR